MSLSMFSVVIKPVTGIGSKLLEAFGWTLEDTLFIPFIFTIFTFSLENVKENWLFVLQ